MSKLNSLLITLFCVLLSSTAHAQLSARQPTSTKLANDQTDDLFEEIKRLRSEIDTRTVQMQLKIQELRKKMSQGDYGGISRKKRLTELKPVYSGTITAHVKRELVGENLARANSLLAEWNPVMCSTVDLIELIGEPTKKTADLFEYRFDNGFGGAIFKFKIEGKRILSFEWVPME